MPQQMPIHMPAPFAPPSAPTAAPIATPGLPSNPTSTSVISTLAGLSGSAMAATPQAGRLVVMDGPLTGQGFNVQGPIEIGREAQPVTLPYDTMASRRHARISSTPSGFEITDLGSTNGTYVNGTKVSSRLLQTGDMIKIGGTTFRFES
jgi:pSer/pThr/pTyr-binding forkhead associated (FHA) protein